MSSNILISWNPSFLEAKGKYFPYTRDYVFRNSSTSEEVEVLYCNLCRRAQDEWHKSN